MSKSLMTAIVVALAALSAHAQQDPTAACLERLEHDHRLEPLRARIGSPMSGADVTLEMQNSPDKVSAEEKPLLSIWAAARRECVRAGEEFRARYLPPEYVATFSAGQSRVFDLISDLWAGGLTWGQFTTQRRRLGEEMTRDLGLALSRAREQAAAQQASQQAAQQQAGRAAAENILLWQKALTVPPLQMPIPAQRPAVNCTTRNVLGTLYTSCQ